MYKQGDIILVPFPFNDNLENSKKRPAVIISKNSINDKSFVVVKMTSVIRNDSFSLAVYERDLVDFTLEKASEIRTNEFWTVNKTIIIKKIGSITRDALEKLTLIIQDNFIIESSTIKSK